ncbi:MAG: NAD(P)/FAD-dependent oxidoreductase [Clostridia bacterium]|jgi:predicted Rossmann fold flavoprotein|nr:NAD(P)/FAD-dependent oxidoreductase [Clostridia bacterium]
MFDLIIIGAGASGLFLGANIKGKKVLILEKKDRAGIKILMSGAGRCNLTNIEDIKGFVERFNNKSFVRKCLYKFDNNKLIDYFTSRGLSTYTDKNGKVFPKSDSSKDVLKLLLSECNKNGAHINYNEKVIEINKNEKFTIKTSKGEYEAKNVVIVTGGMSYPTTGSEGDGYSLAKNLGHKIINYKPALTSVNVKDYSFTELSGISIKDSRVKIFRDTKKVMEYIGDILFTHKNISGPGVINISREILKGDVIKISIVSDYENEEVFRAKVKKDISESSKNIKNVLKGYEISERLIDKIIQLSDIDVNKKDLSKKEINRLISNLIEFEFEVTSLDGFNKAMVTSGGIDVEGVNSKTMESKIIAGLYMAGEVLDIDGETGGYNLQFAFSSAMAIAYSIRR